MSTYTGNRFRLAHHLLIDILPKLKATHVFGNIEYEVDELRRDIEVVKLGAKGEAGEKVKAVFVHDRLAVPPGILKSGKGTPYAVYSPWQRRKFLVSSYTPSLKPSAEWAAYLSNNPENLEEYPEPEGNDADFREDPIFKLSSVSQWSIPDEIEGFKCLDRELMSKIWPEGTEIALKVRSA